MDSGFDVKPLRVFVGKSDVTYNEVKLWKAAFLILSKANEVYAEQIKDAAELLQLFSLLESSYTESGNNSKADAARLSKALTAISVHHRHIFGDMTAILEKDGPIKRLLKVNNIESGRLSQLAKQQVEDYRQAEKQATHAWKNCIKQKKKMETSSSRRLSSTDRDKEDAIYTNLLTKYQTCMNVTAQHWDRLAQQTETNRSQFLREEKGKLDTMFDFINDVMGRIQTLTPSALSGGNGIDLEPEIKDTDAMATVGWEERLQNLSDAIKSFEDDKQENNNKEFDLSMPSTKPQSHSDVDDDAPKSTQSSSTTLVHSETSSIEQKGDGLKGLDCARDCTCRGMLRSGDGLHQRWHCNSSSSDISQFHGTPHTLRSSGSVGLARNATVFALGDRKKTSSEELSLKYGEKITQKKVANRDGMAFGYKRSRLFRKYGFYPACLVSLSSPAT